MYLDPKSKTLPFFQVKTSNIPLVIDADGLWHLTNSPSAIKGYTRAVLTPNAMEFARLARTVLKGCIFSIPRNRKNPGF